MAQKLFVGGLAFYTSSERLREVFAQAGVVTSAQVVMDHLTGRHAGSASSRWPQSKEPNRRSRSSTGTSWTGGR